MVIQVAPAIVTRTFECQNESDYDPINTPYICQQT